MECQLKLFAPLLRVRKLRNVHYNRNFHHTHLAKPIRSFCVITARPRDLKYSTKLPLSQNSVMIYIGEESKETPNNMTRFLWFKALKKTGLTIR